VLRRAPHTLEHQPACKPGSVGRGLENPRATAIPLRRQLPDAFSNLPGRLGSGHPSRDGSPAPPLFGLAPGGVCPAACVAASAVRSYRTISPLPLRPTRRRVTESGGLFSVALSLGSRPPDVIRHRMSMEPGLSSRTTFRHWSERPSSRLTSKGWGRRAITSRGGERPLGSSAGWISGVGRDAMALSALQIMPQSAGWS